MISLLEIIFMNSTVNRASWYDGIATYDRVIRYPEVISSFYSGNAIQCQDNNLKQPMTAFFQIPTY
jgi:hypothetical protein